MSVPMNGQVVSAATEHAPEHGGTGEALEKIASWQAWYRYRSDGQWRAISNALAQGNISDITELLGDDAHPPEIAGRRYQEFVAEAQNLDPVQAASELMWDSDYLAMLSFIDREALRSYLAENIPSVIMKRILGCDFGSVTGRAGADAGGFCTYVEDDRGAGIVLGVETDQLYDSALRVARYAEAPVADALAYLRSEVLYNMSHEFGHAMHGTIPLAALVRWEERIAGEEEIPISANVRGFIAATRREVDDQSKVVDAALAPVRLRRERFADATARFVEQPEVLYAIAPGHYAGMQELYDELMPGYREGALAKRQAERIAAADLEQLRARHAIEMAAYRQ